MENYQGLDLSSWRNRSGAGSDLQRVAAIVRSHFSLKAKNRIPPTLTKSIAAHMLTAAGSVVKLFLHASLCGRRS